MEDIYEDHGNGGTDDLTLIKYYALYDPNCEQGLIQGLRYYPRNYNTVIPDNPQLDTKINYYKPYTNPKVVLPKPRYKKKLSSSNKPKALPNQYPINTINQKNDINNLNNNYDNQYNNQNENNNTNNNRDEAQNINENEDVHRTYRMSYTKE